MNIHTLFQLKPNFTKDELKKAYLQKVQSIQQSNLQTTDKEFYQSILHSIYKQEKSKSLPTSFYYQTYSSFSQKYLSDGNRIVVSSTHLNDNGKKTSTKQSFLEDQYGKKTFIPFEEALQKIQRQPFLK